MAVSVSLWKSPTLHYKIIKLQTKHNHTTNYYDLYPHSRLLNDAEKAEFFDFAKCNIGPKHFKNLVEQKTGKKLTTKDVNNYKQRFSIPIRNEQAHGEMVLEKIHTLLANNPNWVIHYEKNQNNNLQFVLLQATHMREILEKYPEILFIDGTYKVNIEGYILYSILIEDGGGRGRPVCYAFLRNETTEIVQAMFAKFADFNPFVVSACRVVMIDKDMNELRILTKILPNSEILLCTWHVLHCFQQKVNEKARLQRDQLLPLLKKIVYSFTVQDYLDRLAELEAMASKDFISYYMQNWHSCKEMWVHAYRQKLPTFGNNTNNRIESHNQKIKSYLTSSMHLVQAIEALVSYIDTDFLSLKFSKFKEMKLNLNINDAIEPFQLALSRNCTSEATGKVLEQYERFKKVDYLVTSTTNSYVVASASSEHSVSLCLTRCMCAFYNQYSLPCAHILAARHFAQQDLFDKACIPDRWCKDHFLSDSCMASGATPVVTSSIQMPPSVKLDTVQEKCTTCVHSLPSSHQERVHLYVNCTLFCLR
ncbi:zinc finger SWIM domain-containing protein 1-like [Dermacentor silvarum]|nr:zinc finger SWIM domain-containing protein 1-like [Dermacentor silvarum]